MYVAIVQVKAAILAASAGVRVSAKGSDAIPIILEYNDLIMLQAKSLCPLDNVTPIGAIDVKMKKGWVDLSSHLPRQSLLFLTRRPNLHHKSVP